ncbi:DsrE family protein [Allofournierella sp.]|uniref:DsrE family protein n=1 Tax=Allofournierella sp. TaxID=1940256 RepID=UPI003AB1A572
MKVIFHIDDPERWPLALGNAENLLAYCQSRGGLGCTVELLANGPAVTGYLPTVAALPRMRQLAAFSEVSFTACANALRGQGIDPGILPSFVAVVPAGVAELATRQAEGYAYIKP